MGSNVVVSNQSVIPERDERAEAIAALTIDHIASYQASDDALLSVAAAIPTGPLFYLRNRERTQELLGIGSVASFRSDSLQTFRETFDWLVPALRNHPQRDSLFLLGGTSFDGEMPSNEWGPFGAAHFIIPRCLFVRERDTVRVLLMDHRGAPIDTNAPTTATTCSASWEHIEPAPTSWEAIVTTALHHLASGSLDKVVLARRAEATLDTPAHPAALLKRLLSSPQRVAGFAFAPSSAVDQCFFGATPELLFSVNDTLLKSEAVAGTLQTTSPKNAASKRDNSALHSSLRPSQKEQHEHSCVVDAIVTQLQTVSEQVEAETSPTVTPLHDLFHLVTPIQAQLSSAMSPFDLIALLHPTPAVCGTPRAAAREFIRRHEPFERGWYAGTIGYLNGYRAEFSVSLRSALLQGQKLSAYVGAGIVEGSTPAKEWEELNLKQRRLEEILARPAGASSELTD